MPLHSFYSFSNYFSWWVKLLQLFFPNSITFFSFKVDHVNSVQFNNVLWSFWMISSIIWVKRNTFLEVLVPYSCDCGGCTVKDWESLLYGTVSGCQYRRAERREGTAISVHADPIFLNVCTLSVFQQWLIMHAYSVHLLTVRLEIMSSIKESKTENCGWRLEDNERIWDEMVKQLTNFPEVKWGEENYMDREERVTRFASPEGNTWVSKAAKEIKFYVSLYFWLGFYVNAILHHAAFDIVITIITLGCTQEWSVTVKEVIHG